MLGRLGFRFPCRGNEGHERQMDQLTVGRTHLKTKLTDRFQERLGFDVADGATDF